MDSASRAAGHSPRPRPQITPQHQTKAKLLGTRQGLEASLNQGGEFFVARRSLLWSADAATR